MVPVDEATDHSGRPLLAPRPALFTRARYLQLLTWCFTFFSTVRVLSYLPTLWAIQASGQSEQHSLLTWCTWLGANLTMAAWLHEHNGHRARGAVLVNLANAAMCALTVSLIAWYRL